MGETTILGEHISTIRHEKIRDGRRKLSNLWKVNYKIRRKTTTLKPVLQALATDEFIYTSQLNHKEMIGQFNLNPSSVELVGWRLDDGSYVWLVN